MINIKGRESREKSAVGWALHISYRYTAACPRNKKTAACPRNSGGAKFDGSTRINKFRKGKHENKVLRSKHIKSNEIKCYEANSKVLRNNQQTCFFGLLQI